MVGNRGSAAKRRDHDDDERCSVSREIRPCEVAVSVDGKDPGIGEGRTRAAPVNDMDIDSVTVRLA